MWITRICILKDDQENQEQDAYKVRKLAGYLGNKLSLSMNLY